ncbi:hypothetical protein MRX96_058132, partial [Rhipicephalus microplus]
MSAILVRQHADQRVSHRHTECVVIRAVLHRADSDVRASYDALARVASASRYIEWRTPAPGSVPALQRLLAPESESALEGTCVTDAVPGDLPVAGPGSRFQSKAKLTWADNVRSGSSSSDDKTNGARPEPLPSTPFR